MMAGRKPLPTDREILDAIYDRYYDEFKRGARDAPPDPATTSPEDLRESKVYVPIDIAGIARGLKVDADIVFGRLYYYLDYKHRYEDQTTHSWVHLFTRRAGQTVDCVNFPYMASVLAGLREDAGRHQQSTVIAVVALIVSIVAIVASG